MKWLLAGFIALLMLQSGCADKNEESEQILVFASASLRNVMQDIAEHYEDKTAVKVIVNLAGANVLARQIEAAGQADIYLSANEQWMDYLAERDLIYHDTRQTFLSNSLVVVAHKDSQQTLALPSQLPALSFKFLSLADPNAVPAGRYARQYLQEIQTVTTTEQRSVWEELKHLILPAPDVRAAAGMVENTDNILGIVYKTDAVASNKLKILYEFQHQDFSKAERVKYVAAAVKDKKLEEAAVKADDRVLHFLNYLMAKDAQAIFQLNGFASVTDTQAR